MKTPIEIVDRHLMGELPEHFTEDFTVASVASDKHGIIFPPVALANLIRWILRNPKKAEALAVDLDGH